MVKSTNASSNPFGDMVCRQLAEVAGESVAKATREGKTAEEISEIPLIDPDGLLATPAGKEAMAELQTRLGETANADPAFIYAMRRCDFFLARPWYDISTGEFMLTKKEGKIREQEWNDLIDEYISSGVDSRPQIDIEREAKVSWRGDPKWLPCGNPACSVVDPGKVVPHSTDSGGGGGGGSNSSGDGIVCLRPTFETCVKCRTVAYCSRKCQVAAWKPHHKAACSDAKPPVSWLPSSKRCVQLMHGDFF